MAPLGGLSPLTHAYRPSLAIHVTTHQLTLFDDQMKPNLLTKGGGDPRYRKYHFDDP